MRLIDKRLVFTGDVGLLLAFAAARGLRVIIDQALRTKREAEWNASHCRVQVRRDGKRVRCERHVDEHDGSRIRHAFKAIGILLSTHRSGLAVDLYVIDDAGQIVNDRAPYAELGAYWKSLRPANCWGGDFTGFADLGHFSREHRGRK